ncbi:MAG TPA: holin [Candidatus Saccharimonadales bacterium]|nr:holin [Candidatus Saccharimonadales bacterium]
MFNNELLNNFTIQAAVVIPIITAVVQAIKLTGFVKDRFTPFVSMVVGILITFLLAHHALDDISGSVLLGILFGLAASGLYSGLQHTVAIIKADKLEKQQKQQKHQEAKVEKITTVEKTKK